MAEAGSVSALLKLDASGFDSSMTKSVEKITNFAKTMEKVGKDGANFANGLEKVTTEINNLRTQLKALDTISTFENFNRLSTAMKKMVDSAILFNKEGSVTVNTFTQLGNGIRSFMNALGGVDVKLTNVVTAEERLTATSSQLELALARVGANLGNGYNNYLAKINEVNTALTQLQTKSSVTFAKGLNNGAEQLTKNFDKVTNSTKTMSNSFISAGNSSNNFKNKVGGLTQSLNMLKGVVGMVGSMFIYNFAHNMMVSVQNTVKAKSEMLSFLHTMGMSSGQIDSFNAALDRTAERFQRINKYNIGETVANIGLEFDLSAQEMEKAMSVTSMVTSEYLRAGRNADEAALAVKDIMQGQFQRLSRETGVKGEQLKEAGWSGDENDVMGLLDALEKVAKSRHWDTFAEKASSLNDIILITQNRLSEWATDMSEGLVPIVTGAFNALVNTIDKATGFFVGLGKSLNLPEWSGTALLIAGITAAIGGLVLATITWRTELGLLQIAQLGLKQSLVAAVFGIKAEELAEVNATTALKAKILGVQSETLANQGLINILKAKVLGLDAEVVAQDGVSAAIEKKLIEQKAEELQNAKNTTSNISLLESYVSLKTGIETSEMAGLKWHQKLALLNKETDVVKAKNMNVIQSLKAFISSLNAARVATTLFTASLVALSAVAIGGFVLATMDSAKTMKNFNDLVENGDDKIRKVKEAFGETSDEAKNMTEAVERARSAMSKFEERKDLANQRAGRTVAKYLEDAGIDADRIREITDSSLRDANAGVSLVAKTGDEIEKTYRGAANAIGLMKDKLKGEEYEEYSKKMLTSAERIAVAQEKMMMSDSAIDRGFGWIDFTVEQLGHWWNEFSKNLEHQDWGAAWDNIWEGFMQGFGHIPIASDIWNTIFKALNVESFVKKGDLGGTLGNIGGALSDWILGGIVDAIKNIPGIGDIMTLIGEAITTGQNGAKGLEGLDKWFTDALNSFDLGKIISDWWNQSDWSQITNIGDDFNEHLIQPIMNALGSFDQWITGALEGFNADATYVLEWINQTFITPLVEGFNNFMADPLAFMGDMLGGAMGITPLLNALFGGEEGVSTAVNGFIDNIVKPFVNLPMNIWNYLNQVSTNIINWGIQLLTHGVNAGNNLLTGVTTTVSQLPSRVYSYITSTASYIINGASQWVSNARSKASETVNAVINQVSQLPDKVYNEFMKIAQRIRDAISGAVQAATQFGGDVVNAVLGALHINSPGIIQNKIATEFADIPSRISEQNANAYNEATSFGQSIVSGMDSQMTNVVASATALTNAMNQTQPDVVLDQSFVGDYQADANTIGGINQTMTSDTTMAFDTMGNAVNSTITGITSNVQSSYTAMNTNQTTALTTMQNNNKLAYTNLQNQTTSSLNNMRNTTQNVTVQMINAWDHMKNNIIASADQLKTQSTAHFNTLSSNIGSFYQKLQNPSMWGAGDNKMSAHHYSPHRGLRGANEVRRAFGVPVTGTTGRYAGGPTPDNIPQRMTLRKLRSIVGSPSLFRGMDLDQEVDVAEFLSMFGGGFGWNDWHDNHFNYIKDTSGEWDMRGPSIMHRIDTGMAFKVKEFYNAQPQISFSSFQSMAEALFSAIPYEFYYNSDAHGSWVGALQAGSCNCYDGANALVALAATCGFSGHTENGTWNGIPHVYAVINGKKMDTTGWQQRRDWNGVAAGSPPNMRNGGDKTVNITVDMTGATIIGEADFREKMESIANEVMRREINTSITVGI